MQETLSFQVYDYALYAVYTILYKQERSMDEPKDFTYLAGRLVVAKIQTKGEWKSLLQI